MEQKKDYRIIIILLAGILLIIAIQKIYFSTAAQERRILDTVNDINQKCPLMLDNDTQLQSLEIINEKHEIIYKCVLINIIKDSININDYEEHTIPLMIENTKSDPNKRIFRANKMTITYHYKDKDDNFILKHSVSPEIYNINDKNKNNIEKKESKK
jgi:hypothetical protein